MTGDELRELLTKANLSQTRAAEILGVTARSIRRYVAGHHPIPKYMEFAFLYVAKQKRLR